MLFLDFLKTHRIQEIRHDGPPSLGGANFSDEQNQCNDGKLSFHIGAIDVGSIALSIRKWFLYPVLSTASHALAHNAYKVFLGKLPHQRPTATKIMPNFSCSRLLAITADRFQFGRHLMCK